MGGAPAGSSRYRLDPQYPGARPAIAGMPFALDVTRGVVAFGNDAAKLVPFTAYRGVSVRMEETREAGRVRVFLELLHTERALTVPLAIADDPDTVVADWQEWGRVLLLPLLVVAADGTISAPLATMGSLVVFPPKARRRPAHFRARRPRFLVRRRIGRATGRVVSGREIIART